MRRFIECLLPVTACNLKCSYCYIIQENRRNTDKAVFKYSPEVIKNGLTKERLGGTCLISITGSGETFIPKELPAVVKGILENGHFVNITTNGTLSKQIGTLLFETEGYHQYLHISFSFHYLELKKKNLLDCFFNNIKMVKKAGCSFLLQINLCDDYLPYWEEIKEISLANVGAYPQVALTRRESKHGYSVMTSLSFEEYVKKGKEMNSPLFDFTCKNFNVKRNEFCYAGLWSAKLNLCTGEMTGCYGLGIHQNIFDNVDKPIKFEPIGNHCHFKYCFNSSHFLSQGIIPELLPLPSYGELRNREEAHWYTKEMKEFLYKQFECTNLLLTDKQKWLYNKKYVFNQIAQRINNKLKKMFT